MTDIGKPTLAGTGTITHAYVWGEETMSVESVRYSIASWLLWLGQRAMPRGSLAQRIVGLKLQEAHDILSAKIHVVNGDAPPA